jgi:hypothetical protein
MPDEPYYLISAFKEQYKDLPMNEIPPFSLGSDASSGRGLTPLMIMAALSFSAGLFLMVLSVTALVAKRRPRSVF